ncbi:hypothetical protein CASFOL_035092 [Castilleja foliolosa]|uniref:Fatty acyl-CoA reductase n=1 Tax=Castilleja foliolosa TaxID=1961234 RepID=A0ABD3BRV2_9LAMI
MKKFLDPPLVVDTELFRVVREKWGDEEFKSNISSKLIPVSGDISHENLGITSLELREEMCREIDIVINSAATTNFDERYDVAFGINVMGSKNVQDFARKCSKLEMLLHISTGLLLEKPFKMGEIPNLDIEEEKKIIEERLIGLHIHKASQKEITKAMKDLGIQRAIMHGWPNTYVFTKAMGEMMLGAFTEKGNVVIIRPTIITSTYCEPFPGWIEGLTVTIDSIFVAYGKGKLKFFLGDHPESIVDMIPGDMVVNCMITAIAAQYRMTTL